MLIDVKSIEIEQVLLLLLLQVGLIIAAARVMGMLARRIGQPEVIGEIVAGLLLGPSLLGWLAPEMHLALFDPSAMHGVPQGLMPIIVKILSQIGLVLLLFVIGLEFDFSHLVPSGMATASISLAGIALPMTLGAGLAVILYPRLIPEGSAGPDFGSFQLFLAVSLAITALPILGRLLVEWGAARTRFASIFTAPTTKRRRSQVPPRPSRPRRIPGDDRGRGAPFGKRANHGKPRDGQLGARARFAGKDLDRRKERRIDAGAAHGFFGARQQRHHHVDIAGGDFGKQLVDPRLVILCHLTEQDLALFAQAHDEGAAVNL